MPAVMLKKKYHTVHKVRIERGILAMEVDGQNCRFVVSKISQKLGKAAPLERKRFEISPSGYGIHWPLLDEDLSIDGLLGVSHRPHDLKNA